MPPISNKHRSISHVDIVYDIEGLSDVQIGSISKGHVMIYRVRYRIQYSIDQMSFTAELNLTLPRLYHACAEESQRHVQWIPAPSFCAIPQLDPQRFDEERSFHNATSTCWFRTAYSQSRCRVLLLESAATSLGILPPKAVGNCNDWYWHQRYYIDNPISI
jgi:hypothetical protein